MTDPQPRSFPCWNCGAGVTDLPLPLSRHEYCPACAEALHCCRQCRLFAPDRADQCLEDRAEHPTDKTAANFCDYFQLRDAAPEAGADDVGSDARSRLDALFGAGSAGSDKPDDGSRADPSAPPSGTPESDARSRLDALFGGDDD